MLLLPAALVLLLLQIALAAAVTASPACAAAVASPALAAAAAVHVPAPVLKLQQRNASLLELLHMRLPCQRVEELLMLPCVLAVLSRIIG